ncbi:MAG TPA: hypothetical protein VKG20_20585 [Methylomirabilota bacterium]|nr:hypothetical protein [Methylomirabilota bacterium]
MADRQPLESEQTIGIVFVPAAERATYRRQPGEIVIDEAQLAGIARLIGPVLERRLAAKRAAEAEAKAEAPRTEAPRVRRRAKP